MDLLGDAMKRAAFWIVSDKKYADEAKVGAAELREHMPDLDQILFTCEETTADYPDQGTINQVIFIAPPIEQYWYLDSVKYFNWAFDELMISGYDQALYLDSDTNFLAPFPELFDMLHRFDIVAPVGSRRVTGATFHDLPLCFPEYEIGVVAFNVIGTIQSLFTIWRNLHHEHPEVYGNNDMRSFREAVWLMRDLRIERIPTEYALRWPFGVFVSLEVKILHGRPMGDGWPDSPTLDEVKAIVNQHLDMRVWSPRDPRWRDGVIPKDYEGSE